MMEFFFRENYESEGFETHEIFRWNFLIGLLAFLRYRLAGLVGNLMEEVSVEQRWIRECNFNGFFCEVLRKISKFWENEIQEGFEYQSILVFQTKIKVSVVLDYFKANLEIIQKFFYAWEVIKY